VSYIWADTKALWLKCGYGEKENAKRIPGAYFSKPKKAWKFSLDIMTFKALCALFPDAEVDPDARDKILNLRNKYKRLIKAKSEILANPDPELKNTLELPLFDHQHKSFAFYSVMDPSVDFSEPGAGKTAVQIALIKHRAINHGIQKVLIICPLSLMITELWKNEINRFFPQWSHPIITLDKSTDKAISELKNHPNGGVFIINYEKTWRIRDLLVKYGFEMMIVDESSRIKNHAAKQSKAIHKISEGIRFKSILTGTPTPNSFMELFSQMKVVDPMLFGSSFYTFRERFFKKDDWDEFNWTPKPKTESQIKQMIDVYAMSWKKDECLDLPPLTTQIMSCKLSIEQRKAYEQMSMWMIAVLEDYDHAAFEANIILTKILRLCQITSGFIQNTDGAGHTVFKSNPKLDLLMSILEEIPTDRKIIVWAVFQQDIRSIVGKVGKTAVSYYGGNSKKINQTNIGNFKTDPACKVLVANPRSAGMGLDLSCASYSIYFSMSYSFEDYAQSRERFNRTGQKHPMTEYILTATNTMDGVILDAVMNKKKINDFVTTVKKHIKSEA